MAAPTYSWNTQTSSQTDGDSPINEILMEGTRQNLVHLKEVLYDTYTPVKAHTHNGTDSALVTNIADGAVSTAAKLASNVVTLAKLKITQGSYTTGLGSGTIDLAINQYAHWPLIRISGNGSGQYIKVKGPEHTLTGAGDSGVLNRVRLDFNISGTNGWVYWDYHAN